MEAEAELSPFDALSYTYLMLQELAGLAAMANRPALDHAIEHALSETAEALASVAHRGKAAPGDAA